MHLEKKLRLVLRFCLILKQLHFKITKSNFLLLYAFLTLFLYSCHHRENLLKLYHRELEWRDLPDTIQWVYELHYMAPRVEFDTLNFKNIEAKKFILKNKDSLIKNLAAVEFINLESNNVTIDYISPAIHGFYPTDYGFLINGVDYYVPRLSVTPLFIFYQNNLYMVKFKTGIPKPTTSIYFVVTDVTSLH